MLQSTNIRILGAFSNHWVSIQPANKVLKKYIWKTNHCKYYLMAMANINDNGK